MEIVRGQGQHTHGAIRHDVRAAEFTGDQGGLADEVAAPDPRHAVSGSIRALHEHLCLAREQQQEVLERLPGQLRFAEASRNAAMRGDLSPATAMAAAQTLRDGQALLAQSEQDIREQNIALELLTGALQEAWKQ